MMLNGYKQDELIKKKILHMKENTIGPKSNNNSVIIKQENSSNKKCDNKKDNNNKNEKYDKNNIFYEMAKIALLFYIKYKLLCVDYLWLVKKLIRIRRN